MGSMRAKRKRAHVLDDDYAFLSDPGVIVEPVFIAQLPTTAAPGDTMSFGVFALYLYDPDLIDDFLDDDEPFE